MRKKDVRNVRGSMIACNKCLCHCLLLHSLLSEPGQVKRTCEALLCGPSSPSLAQQYFSPEIIRLTPPLHVAEDEVRRPLRMEL